MKTQRIVILVMPDIDKRFIRIETLADVAKPQADRSTGKRLAKAAV